MSEHEVASLRDQVRNLQDRVSALESQLQELLDRSHGSTHRNTNSEVASESGYSVVSSSSRYNSLADEIPEVSSEAVALCSGLRGGSLTALQRAERAWSAGYWARFTLQGRISRPRPSLPCDVSNTTYIVLRAEGWNCPVRTDRASTYRGIVGDFRQDTLSHGFASQAEARTYCLAAGDNTVELYRVFWPPDPLLVQARPGIGIAVMTRRSGGGGVLLALPSALVPAGSLPATEGDGLGVIGLYTRLDIPAVRMQDDGNVVLGIDLDVYLIDLAVEGLKAVTPMAMVPEEEDIGLIGFHEDLDVIPDPEDLLAKANFWVASQIEPRITFYSAEEEGEMVEAEGGELPDGAGMTPPVTPGPVPTSPAPAKANPKAKAKEAAKPKRVTTATLAAQMSTLMELMPEISQQLVELKQDHHRLRSSVEEAQQAPPVRPSQVPVSKAVASFAHLVGPPPRTKAMTTPALAVPLPPRTSGLDANLTTQEQAEEQSPKSGDPMALAVLEQSKALMSLVQQLQQGGDPLLDGQASSSGSLFGTRGSQGRERLQQELSTKSGSFFAAVLQNAAKRLKPAGRRIQTIEEAAASDFSMIQYLERFGGYGAFKELGLIQFALAHIFDALVHADVDAARDFTALLMTGVDQANLDGNRWELAYRMMLLEEPPSQLWTYRSSGFDPRSRSFSPLAPQKWTTIASAYSKEMDYIQNKRAELTNPKAAAPSTSQPSQPAAAPKKRGRFPKAKAAPGAPNLEPMT
eukprot:Skav223315  [mRNA]  locus=scaffold200:39439:41741:+ [translate_table: standard]